MTMNELWRDQYRVRRYLEFCTDESLMDRFQVIMHNFFEYSPDGKVFPTARSTEWSEVMTHLVMEYALRAQAMPTEVKGGMFDPRRYNKDKFKSAATLFDKTSCTPGTYLLKYGKLKHLRPLLMVGNLRIAPASHYDDKSLNFSVRDTELQFTQMLVGGTFRTPPDGNEAAPMDQWKEIPHIGHATMTTSSATNFYIACFGASYGLSLFDDFEANACLVIKDVPRFSKSIVDRVGEALPGWKMSSRHVDYRDPYRTKVPDSVPFTKDFRYAYQKEFRYMWMPPSDQSRLLPIHVELGPLKEYCELLSIDEAEGLHEAGNS